MRAYFRSTLWMQFPSRPNLILLIAALAVSSLPAAALARTTPIDVNSSEVLGDADDGQTVALPFDVDYGSGPQAAVTVNLPPSTPGDEASVGLTFTNSPADSLFATLFGNNGDVPVVMLSNGPLTSRPAAPVSPASTFDFGNMPLSIAPPPPGSPNCDVTGGGTTLCYGPFSGSAEFQFTDLSSSGNPGDFELLLLCDGSCANIGFNLDGVNFSSIGFDPAAAPPQLVSYTTGFSGGDIAQGTFDFIFRNTAAIPEPSTWASMLLGFAFMGVALRRQRKRALRPS